MQLAIFLGYLWLLGRSKEIKRVFAFHGAEHMSIHAYEAGDPLSVERVQKYPPEHPRCGTSFLLLVMVLAILIFGLLGRLPWPLLIASRVIGIPVIAGISYEMLKLSGANQNNLFGRFMAAPGLWLQRLTTRYPDPDQIEVAVASLLSALEEDRRRRCHRPGRAPRRRSRRPGSLAFRIMDQGPGIAAPGRAVPQPARG